MRYSADAWGMVIATPEGWRSIKNPEHVVQQEPLPRNFILGFVFEETSQCINYAGFAMIFIIE